MTIFSIINTMVRFTDKQLTKTATKRIPKAQKAMKRGQVKLAKHAIRASKKTIKLAEKQLAQLA